MTETETRGFQDQDQNQDSEVQDPLLSSCGLQHNYDVFIRFSLFSIFVFYQIHRNAGLSNPDIIKNSAQSACMPGPNISNVSNVIVKAVLHYGDI